MKMVSARVVMCGILICAGWAAGCGMSSPLSSVSGGDQGSPASTMMAQAKLMPGSPDAEDASSPAPATPSADEVRASGPTTAAARRMIIITGNITVEVPVFMDAAGAVTKAAQELGGFVGGTQESLDDGGHRYGSVSIRVPAAQYAELVQRVRALGKVLKESSNGQDITEEYVDLESRLKAQKKLEEELLVLMESARRGGLRDLLEIEREVARVRGEIESMQGRMRYLADQASLSTLTVELREPAALVQVEQGAMDPIFESLGEAVSLFAKSMAAIILFVAVMTPWALALWVAVAIVRWWWRRRAAKSGVK